MTDCEKIHFAEAAESAELRYILSEMAKYPECDFSDFRRVYGSEQKLRCYAKNQKVREKFDLIDPDFSDSVVFGLYSLFSEKNKIEQARCAAGGMAKSKLYDRYFSARSGGGIFTCCRGMIACNRSSTASPQRGSWQSQRRGSVASSE